MTKNSFGHGRSRFRAALAIAAAAAGVLTAMVGSLPAGAAAAPVTTHVKVVGGPDSADATVVIITVNAAHNLLLEGIAPRTHKVVWTRPYSASGITPGVSPDAYPLDNNVIDLVPAVKPSNPIVNVLSINATTGAVAWVGPKNVIITDIPGPCADGNSVCLDGVDQSGNSTLVVLNPTTGALEHAVSGPYRAMTENLFETSANKSTFEQITQQGTVAWTKTVTSIFGSGYDPDNGWDMNPIGSLDVGTIENSGSGSSEGYDQEKTIGFSLASGAVAWTLNGEYQCGGSLYFLTPSVTCAYSGTIHATKKQENNGSLKGLTLTLEGFNPATGARTWSLPVRNDEQIENGNAEILDDNRMLVTLANGQPAVLDARTGTTTAVGKHQLFWCSTNNEFKVNESKDLNPDLMRAQTTLFHSCTASGKSAPGLPATMPDSVGSTVDGVYVWASPQGLVTQVVGSSSGLA